MMQVQVYSTPTCHYCKLAKDYFDEKGVEYEDIDVSKDREKAMKLIEETGSTSVPQIKIGEKWIIGFDKYAIDKELNL